MIQHKIIEEHFEEHLFIGGWYLPPEYCDEIIEYFNFNKKYTDKGVSGLGLNTEIKQSYDLGVGSHNFDCIWGVYRKFLHKCLEKYWHKYSQSNEVNIYGIVEDFNIQKYPIGGGFKNWHCENTGHNIGGKRHLVFMTYLNDVEDGGTEFLYQKITTPAKKGLTLIWPAPWTHTHRGQVSNTKEKYIVTGWYSFLESQNKGDSK